MTSSNRIPMFLIEREVGGDLPNERTYGHSGLGAPVGYVIMPDGMTVERYADYLSFHFDFGDGKRPSHVASLSGWRVVQAAIEKEFGLTWEPKGKS